MYLSRFWKSKSTELVVRTAGVIALEPEDVFTARSDYKIKYGDKYAKLVAKGSFHPALISFDGWDSSPVTQTLPLNFGNLQDPVPASAYYEARMLDCWANSLTVRQLPMILFV
jgi:hypothetical protein